MPGGKEAPLQQGLTRGAGSRGSRELSPSPAAVGPVRWLGWEEVPVLGIGLPGALNPLVLGCAEDCCVGPVQRFQAAREGLSAVSCPG